MSSPGRLLYLSVLLAFLCMQVRGVVINLGDKTGCMYKDPTTNKVGLKAEMKKKVDENNVYLTKAMTKFFSSARTAESEKLEKQEQEEEEELKEMVMLKLVKDADPLVVLEFKKKYAGYFMQGEEEGLLGSQFTSSILIAEIHESEVNDVINEIVGEYGDLLKLIEYDRQIQSTRSWSLDYMNQEWVNDSHEDGNFDFDGTGEGVDIFILDTAVRTDAPEFLNPDGTTRFFIGSTCVSGLCFPQFCSSTKCGNGHTDNFLNNHGSTVGVCAAGDFQYGVANRARLNVMEVLDPITGLGSISSLVRALEYVALLKDYVSDKVVINLSLGLTEPIPERACSSAFYDAIEELVDTHKFAVVSASGNSGDNACNYCLQGSKGLVVGATTRGGDIAGFSNTGSCVDVYAPGANVEVPAQFGTFVSGTSFSSPYVTGILAVLMERHDIDGKEAMDLLIKLAYNDNKASSPVEIDENILEAYLPPSIATLDIDAIPTPPETLFADIDSQDSDNKASRMGHNHYTYTTIALLVLTVLI